MASAIASQGGSCIRGSGCVKAVMVATGVVLLVSIAAAAVLLVIRTSPYAYFSVGIVSGLSLGLFFGSIAIWSVLSRLPPVSPPPDPNRERRELLFTPDSFVGSPRIQEQDLESPHRQQPSRGGTALGTRPSLSLGAALCHSEPMPLPVGNSEQELSAGGGVSSGAEEVLVDVTTFPPPALIVMGGGEELPPPPEEVPTFCVESLPPPVERSPSRGGSVASSSVAPLSLAPPLVEVSALRAEMAEVSQNIETTLLVFMHAYADRARKTEYAHNLSRYEGEVTSHFDAIRQIVERISDRDQLSLLSLQMHLLSIGLCYTTHQELLTQSVLLSPEQWLQALQAKVPTSPILPKMIEAVRGKGWEGCGAEVAKLHERMRRQQEGSLLTQLFDPKAALMKMTTNLSLVLELVRRLYARQAQLSYAQQHAHPTKRAAPVAPAMTQVSLGDPHRGVVALFTKVRGAYAEGGRLASRSPVHQAALKALLSQTEGIIKDCVEALALSEEDKKAMRGHIEAILSRCKEPLYYATLGDNSKNPFHTEPHCLHKLIKARSEESQFLQVQVDPRSTPLRVAGRVIQHIQGLFTPGS